MKDKMQSPKEEFIRHLVKKFLHAFRYDETLYLDIDEWDTLLLYLIRTGRLHYAEVALKMALYAHPTAVELLLDKARLQNKQKAFAESVALLKGLKRSAPYNQDVALLLAETYLLSGARKMALQVFDALLETIPAASSEKQMLYYQIANIFERYGLFAGVREYLDRACKEFPKDSNVLFDLAVAENQVGNYNRSAKLFGRYIDTDMYSETAWFQFGVALTNAGKAAKALMAYDIAISLSANFPEPYYNKALIYLLNQQYKDALKPLLDYVALKEDYPEAYCQLGYCYEKLEDYSNAVHYFRKALQLSPGSENALMGLATVYFYENEMAESLRFAQKALDVDDANSEGWFLYANIMRSLGKPGPAVEALSKAVRLMPEHDMYWLSLAETHAAQGDYTKAAHTLRQSVQQLPDSAPLNFRLAAYLLLEDRQAEGLKILRKALDIDPLQVDQFHKAYVATELDANVHALIYGKMGK